MYELPAGHIAPQTSTQHLTLSWSPTPSIPYEFIHSLLNHNPLPFHLPLSFAPFPILQPCNPPLPPPSAPPSILPPCSSLLLLLLLLLSISSFLSIPPLISQHPSPGSSCHGVVLLAERGRRRHTDGSTDGQQAVRGGQAHLLHTHTNTHIQSLTLPPRHTACLPGTVIQGHKHKYTKTLMHTHILTYIQLQIHTRTYIDLYMHL